MNFEGETKAAMRCVVNGMYGEIERTETKGHLRMYCQQNHNEILQF